MATMDVGELVAKVEAHDPNAGQKKLEAQTEAFRIIAEALRPLKDDETRVRVLRAAAILLGLDDPMYQPPPHQGESWQR